MALSIHHIAANIRSRFASPKLAVGQNKHFIQDYQLFTKSVVLVDLIKGNRRIGNTLIKPGLIFRTRQSLFGLGTALPVIAFAVLIATGANYIGTVFNKLPQIELWVRRITGIIFIGVGIYFTITFLIKF